MRLLKPEDLRFYLYVSRSKIEMLHNQLFADTTTSHKRSASASVPQDLTFLAKTLAKGVLAGAEAVIGVPTARVLLGTPLFVHQVHPMDEDRWGLDAEW